MNKLIFIFFLFTAAVSSSTWKVRTGDVKITFFLPSENKTGTLNGLSAELEFNPADPASSKISASVDVKSLSTNNVGLTSHLLNPDFFDSEKFPSITFVSSSVSKTDTGFTAKGDMTMMGVTKPVEIPFTFVESDTMAVFKGTMNILCGDFGLMSKKENNPDTRTEIKIEVPVYRK